MTKPIDWTKPLRVVGTHERVEAVRIERDGTIWVFGQLPQGNQSVRVDRRGGGWIALGGIMLPPSFAVENIPTEPRIVERFVTVHPTGGGEYNVCGSVKLERPDIAKGMGCRVAKLLIEEPGE